MHDDFKIADGIAIVEVADVDEVRDEPRALEMFQEASAEAGAFVSAFDKTGDIGDDEQRPWPGVAPGSADTTPRWGSSVVNG